MLILTIFIVSGLIGAFWAQSKNKNAFLWGLLCFCFPVIGLIFLAFAKADIPVEEKIAVALNNHLPKNSVDTPKDDNFEYDRSKWAALVQFDEDIRMAKTSIEKYGNKYVDILAKNYLALQDKSYLPNIIEKINDDYSRSITELSESEILEINNCNVFEIENGYVFGLKESKKFIRISSEKINIYNSLIEMQSLNKDSKKWDMIRNDKEREKIVSENIETIKSYMLSQKL